MTSIRQGAAGVLAGMLAGVLSAYGAEVTISGSAGTSGTVSFNGGAPSQTVQISVEEGTRVNVVAAADDEHAFSHWTGDVDAVCEGGALQSNIVVQARTGLSLTAVFGLRNRLDSNDLRPHGYLNRFTQKDDGSWSAAWTDGPWAKNPTWWLDGYVPTNQNDVLHFQNWQQPDSLFHAWIDWPSGDWTLGTIADSSPQSKFNLASGWGHYLYIQNQENSHARWQHEISAMGGFGTTDANTPHRVNRVWAATALGINTAKADHELIIHELSGGGYVRKVGPGRLTLEQPSAGGLRLEQGCVDLGIADAEAGYVPGAYGQYDAAATDTMTWAVAPDGKERLTVWKDVNGTRDRYGNAVRLTAPYPVWQTGWTNIWYGPVRGTKTVRGVPLLDFGAYTYGATADNGGSFVDDSYYPGERATLGVGAGLNVGSAYEDVRTVFMAFEFPSRGGTQSPVSFWERGAGGSRTMVVKASGDGLMASSNDDLKFRGAFYENGAPFKSEVNQNHSYRDGHAFSVIAGCVTNNGPSVPFWHMGMQPGLRLAGGIRVAEALVYTNSLTEAEIARNNLWMQRKWHDRTVNDVYPWSLDYLFLCSVDDSAEIRVDAGRTAAIRTVHRPVWSSLAGRPLVKTGDGMLELDRCSTNLDLVVKGGRVRFIRETAQIADAPSPAPHAYFWGDATRTDRFVFAADNPSNIVCWLDCRADAPHALTNWVETVRFATLNENGLRGLPCVDFGTAFDGTGPRLAFTSATNTSGKIGGYVRNVVDGFIVWHNIAAPGVNPYIFSDTCAYPAFTRTKDSLQPGYGTGAVQFFLENYTSQWRVDGRLMHPENEFNDQGRADYVIVRCRGAGKLCMNQLGGFQEAREGGGCQIAEVIYYDYALSDFAARQTEAYLLKKWKGMMHPDACPEQDRIDSLVFDGARPVLETASDRGFGRIAGSGTLVKTGTGCVTVGTLEGFSRVDVQEGGFAYAADGALPSELVFTLPKEGTPQPMVTARGTLDLASLTSVRIDVEGGEKPVFGLYPLVAAEAFTGDIGGVEVVSNVKGLVSVSLVLVKGRMCVNFAPKGTALIVR